MKLRLQFVETINDIRESIQNFKAESAMEPELTRSLLRGTTYWVWDPISKSFGPSKFVGFNHMSLSDYYTARKHNYSGARFDGNATRQKIEGVLRDTYTANETLSKELEKWGRALVPEDQGVFDGVNLSKWKFITLPEQIQSEADLEEAAIMGRTDIGPTAKTRLIQARRGQGIFKNNVRLNETRCRITGVADPDHLIASHIKPWSKSTDQEKLNGCNGLLLSPHVDHLFDEGFISFKNNGDLMVSSELDPSILDSWGIRSTQNVGRFNSTQANFLAFHRRNLFKK